MGETVREKPKFDYAYLIVASCIVITFIPCALSLCCAGIFFTPVSNHFDVPRASFTLFFSIQNIAMAITSPIAGKLLKKVAPRVVFPSCVAIVGASFVTMSTLTEVWQFYIVGVFLGIGTAPLVFLAVPTLINNWFKTRGGFFVGICMAFTGVGGIVFNPIGTMLIQTSAEGWRMGYLAFGLITLLTALPFTTLVIRNKPEDKGLLPVGASEQNEGAQSNDDQGPVAELPSVTADKAMKSIAFYTMSAFSFFILLDITAYQFFPSYCASFSASAPQIAAISGLVASACMAGQAIGKVVLGAINDKNETWGLYLGIVCGLAGICCMAFLPTQAIVLMVGSFLFGIEYSWNSVEVPLLTRATFGPKDYPNIYSRVAAVGTIGGVVGPILYGVIVDMPNGFTLMFAVSGACMLAAFLLGIYSLRQAKKLRC